MTLQILRSQLAGVSESDFELVVRTHAENLRAFEQHMEHIRAGSKEHQPYPPPHSLPIVDRAVRRPDFVPDYRIIDDVGLGE